MATKRVVGLSFANEAAPVVILKGAGESADELLEQAGAAMPVIRSPELVDRLYRTPIDSATDKDLLPVMTALLEHVLRLDRNNQETPS